MVNSVFNWSFYNKTLSILPGDNPADTKAQNEEHNYTKNDGKN
jgi:hypothetical protein